MDNNSGCLYNSDESNQYSDDDGSGGGFSLRNAVVDELGSDLNKCLKIDNCDNKKRYVDYEEEEDEEEDDGDITESLLVQMGYGKTKTRPAMPPAEEEEEEEEDGDITEDLLNQMGYGKTGPPKHEPPATPIPADNLKSAMKGSGKREEWPDKERKVTWAEDVYDPIPSSPSHFATNRVDRHRIDNKKSGKNRPKWGGKGAGGGAKGIKDKGKDKDKGSGKDKEKKRGGGAMGSKAKDKKQVKKFSGSSTKKCFDTLDKDDTLVDFGNKNVSYDSFY